MANQTKVLKIQVMLDAEEAKAQANQLRRVLLGMFTGVKPNFSQIQLGDSLSQLGRLKSALDATRVSMASLHKMMGRRIRVSVVYSGSGQLPTAPAGARAATTMPRAQRSPREMTVTQYSNVLGKQLGTTVSPQEVVNRLRGMGITLGKSESGKFAGLDVNTIVGTPELKKVGEQMKKEATQAKKDAEQVRKDAAIAAKTIVTAPMKAAKEATEKAVKEIPKKAMPTMAIADYVAQVTGQKGIAFTKEDVVAKLREQRVSVGMKGGKLVGLDADAEVPVGNLRRAVAALRAEIAPFQRVSKALGIPPEVLKSYQLNTDYLDRIAKAYRRFGAALAQDKKGVQEMIQEFNVGEKVKKVAGFKPEDIQLLTGAPAALGIREKMDKQLKGMTMATEAAFTTKQRESALTMGASVSEFKEIFEKTGLEPKQMKKYADDMAQAARTFGMTGGELAKTGIGVREAKALSKAWEEINAKLKPYVDKVKEAQASMDGLQKGTKEHSEGLLRVKSTQQELTKAQKELTKYAKDFYGGAIQKTRGAGEGKMLGPVPLSDESLNALSTVGKQYSVLSEKGNQFNAVLDKQHNMFSRLTTSAINFMKFQMPWFLGASAIFGVLAAFKSLMMAMLQYKQNLADIMAVTQKSASEMDYFGAVIQKVSVQTSLSTSELGKIGLQLIRAGIDDIGEAARATEVAAKVAVVSGEDVKIVANTIATAYFAWGLRAKDMIKVGNTLAATLNYSRLQVEDLGTAYNYLAGTASLMNRTFEETNALMAVLSNMGMKASTIGTSLSFVFARFVTPTKQMKDYFSTLGITMSETDVKVNKFADVLEHLQNKGYDASLSMELFGQRAGRSMMFLAQAGPEAIRQMEQKIDEATALTKGLEAAMSGPIKQFQQLWNVMQKSAIQLGGALIPILQGLVEVLRLVATTIAGGLHFWVSWHGAITGAIFMAIYFRKALLDLAKAAILFVKEFSVMGLVRSFHTLWIAVSNLHWALKGLMALLLFFVGGELLDKLFGTDEQSDVDNMQKALKKTNNEMIAMQKNLKDMEKANEAWRSDLEDIKEGYERIMSDQPSMVQYSKIITQLLEEASTQGAFGQLRKDADEAKAKVAELTEEVKKFNAEKAKAKEPWWQPMVTGVQNLLGLKQEKGPKIKEIEKALGLSDIKEFKDKMKDMEKDEFIRFLRDNGLIGLLLGKEGSTEAVNKGIVTSQKEFNMLYDKVLQPAKQRLIEFYEMGTTKMGGGTYFGIDEKKMNDAVRMINEVDAAQKNLMDTERANMEEWQKGGNVEPIINQIVKMAKDEVYGIRTTAEKASELLEDARINLKKLLGEPYSKEQAGKVRELIAATRQQITKLLQMEPNPADTIEKNAKLREQATRESYELQIKQAEHFQKITEANDNMAIAKLQFTYDMFERITRNYYQQGLISAETYFSQRTEMMDAMLTADELKTEHAIAYEKKSLLAEGDWLKAQLADAGKYIKEAEKGFDTYKRAPKIQDQMQQQVQKAGISVKDVTNKIREMSLKFDQFNAKTNAEKFELLRKRASELVVLFNELRDASGRVFEPFMKNAEILSQANASAQQYYTTMGNFKDLYVNLYEQQLLKNKMDEASIKSDIYKYQFDLQSGALDQRGIKTAEQAIELLKLKLFWTQKNNEELRKNAEAMKDPSGWEAFKLGAKEAVRAMGDFAKAMKDLGSETVKGFQSAMESMFNDILSGKHLRMTDYLKQWGDTMKRSVAKMLSEQVTKEIGNIFFPQEKQKTETDRIIEAQELASKATKDLTASLTDQSGAFNRLIDQLTIVVQKLGEVVDKMREIQDVVPKNVTGGVGELSYKELQDAFGMYPPGTVGKRSYEELKGIFGINEDIFKKPELKVKDFGVAQLDEDRLFNAVMRAESNFNPLAVSKKGASGLMQLMPSTYEWMGGKPGMIFDPEENKRIGTAYLRMCVDQAKGDFEESLARYNWGPGHVEQLGMERMPAETKAFISTVKKYYYDEGEFKQNYGTTSTTATATFSKTKEEIAKTNEELESGSNWLGRIYKDLGKVGMAAAKSFGISSPFAQLLGLGIDIVGGIFSGGSSSSSGGSTTPGGLTNVSGWDSLMNRKHSGGVIKKLHSGGLAGDEVPIIAQLGERMLSKSQNKQLTDVLMGRNIGAVAYGTNREQNAWYKTLLDAVAVRRQERTFDLPRRTATTANNSYEISVPVDVANSAPIRSPERFKADMREEMEKVALDVIRRHS